VAAATVFTTNFVAGSYSINAAAGSISTNFSVTNNPGPATMMTLNARTTPQSATVNTAFASALAVTVTDSHNNPLSGVVIQFTAPSSGASGVFSNSAIQLEPMTNSSGVATAPFTANGIAGGPYSVTAGAPGLTLVSFSLTNTSGAAASITANAGTTPQSATLNTAFANALGVRVKDAGSNPVSGANVVFTAPSTGASGVFSNATNTITVATNGSGIASAPFTANGTAGGPYSVTAMVGGMGTSFSLTNTGSGPVISLNPISQTVPALQTVIFTAAATGTPTPTVEWQVSTDGVNFTGISAATSTTLSFVVSGSMNGNSYRAVFTNTVSSRRRPPLL
jgi:hypothetical protein